MNKPNGKTSHDVVDAVRHLAGFRQIGHLGTLDPLATGVLVLLLGRATRLVRFYSGRRKRYTAGFRFGFATDTYDSDGEAQGLDTALALDPSVLERLAAERIGSFEQTPPAFSAKKVGGRPAYELARKKQEVALKPVQVEVFEYRLTGIEGSVARFVIECSSGTYIRSLAHEMGQKLGCGAHLSEITRTAVGEFSLEQAIALEELAIMADRTHGLQRPGLVEAEPAADAPACAPVPLLVPLLPHAAAVSATAISAPNRTGTGMRVNNDLLIVIVSRLARRWLVASAAPCICFLG